MKLLLGLTCRRYRANPQSKRREWYDVDDVRIVLLAVEDMLAASQVRAWGSSSS